MRVLFLAFLLAASLIAGTTGNIKGTVVDEKKEPIGGVTVVATSKSLLGEQVAMTDEAGLYVISNLPAGIYTLKAMFAEAASERPGIEVYIDKTVHADMTIRLDQAKGEVYQITEKATHIDVASSTVGVTLTKDYIANVPMGRDRNFSNAMNALPSAGKDSYGESVGGATSPENVYVIDGVNATDPSSGLSGTRMVLEFVDQFDVKEGGYGPELGRATGGVVNAGTKSGSNDFHGSVFLYYRPGFLQALPRLVNRVSDSVSRRNKLDYYLNTGFELGGPIVQDKLWFHVGYSPELQRDNWIRDIRPIKNDGTNNPAKDGNGQYIFDNSILSEQYSGFAQTHQYTFKLSHAIDNNNRQSLGIRGAPTLFSGSAGNPFESDAPSLALNGDPSSFQYQQWGGNLVTGIYTYAGKYFNDKLKLDATIGVHHQQSHYWPTTVQGNNPRATYIVNNLSLGTVWDGAPAICKDIFADKDQTAKCLARNYTKGGIGSFSDSQLTRISEKIMLTSLYEFAGLHQLKYGIDLEQLRESGQHGYTGQKIYTVYDDQLKETALNIRGFKDVPSIMPTLAQTLNWGAFVGDSWNPTPNLTINYGLRWEAQEFFGVLKPQMEQSQLSLEHKFSILDNWAPRAGIIWDFLGNGKGALRFNYGRYYESVPMDINQRAFGGEGTRIKIWKHANCGKESVGPGGIDSCKTGTVDDKTLGSQDSIVAPGMKGQYSDEFVLSADYEPFSSWIFGVAGVYRYLGRVIEDMSTDGGATYMFGNPGTFDVNSLDGVRDQINHTSDPAERARLENNVNNLARINEYPKPVRDLWQLQFRVDKKVSDHFMILATYVLSWAYGNYPGLVTANNGQLDPNMSSQFDLPQLVVNRTGYLPQDQRHRIKLSGFYKAKLKDFGINSPLSFNLGLSGGVQSGMPYETLGADQFYGNDEVFLLPRGSGGRTPWTWSVDVNIGAGYDLTDNVTAELFAALYNITNNQDPVAYDETYTYDTVRPIVNGGKDQLPFARNINGNAVKKNPNYGNALAFQAPFSAQVGFRLKF